MGVNSKLAIWHQGGYIFIDRILFIVLFGSIPLKQRRDHYWWRTAKCRPMIDTYDLWEGSFFYLGILAMTRNLGLHSLIWVTARISRLGRQASMYLCNQIKRKNNIATWDIFKILNDKLPIMFERYIADNVWTIYCR